MGVAPVCPRCGYDQSGVVATWEGAGRCELEGVCSECGLGFQWRDLFRPEFAAERRLLEGCERGYAGALWRTAWTALRPSAFWKKVRLEHAVRRPRLAASALAAALVVYFGIAAVLMAWNGAWYAYDALGSATPFWMMRRSPSFWDWWEGWKMPLLWRWGPIDGLDGVGAYLSSRAAVAGLAWVFMPLAFAALPVTLRRARVRAVHIARVAAYELVGIAALLWAGDFAGTVLREVNGLLFRAARGAYLPGWVYTPFTDWRWSTLAIGVGAWHLVWWGLACRRYLRLPTPWVVAVLVTVMAALCAALLLAVIVGPARFMVSW